MNTVINWSTICLTIILWFSALSNVEAGAIKMYFVSEGANSSIQRANVDGTNVETLVTPAVPGVGISPFDIALDDLRGKMYWSDQTNGIFRANLVVCL